MEILKKFFTKKKPKRKFDDIRFSFKNNWYSKELDSLLNTKECTRVERLLNNLSDRFFNMISAIDRTSNDISILKEAKDESSEVYTEVYELNKIFSLSHECKNDTVNLVINTSKICIMISKVLNNINHNAEYENISKIYDKFKTMLDILGNGNIVDLYNNKIQLSKVEIEVLITNYYIIYQKLVSLNKNLVYNNKVYRNQLKSIGKL
jgi:hypothetical protein